jgi:ketosteroid isomerase-like protein
VPTPPGDDDARDGVLTAYREHLQAMTDGDTDTLDELLDDDFTLTHMTGYVQPKAQWLAEMRGGQFRYHHIEEGATTVELHSGRARVVGRTVTDATVYGTRADWRLQLTLQYENKGGHWVALHSVATTW